MSNLMAAPEDQSADGARVIELNELLGEARRVRIRHEERLYVLRLTRQNRLILTRDEAEPSAPQSGTRRGPGSTAS